MSSSTRLSWLAALVMTIFARHDAGAQQTGGTFARTGSMIVARTAHTATLLRNGKVLLAGGQVYDRSDYRGVNTASAELFDPATGTFSMIGSMSVARGWHTATLLPSGKVLIVGGEYSGSNPPDEARTTAELYDPLTERFTPTGGPVGRHFGTVTATLLNTGKVLIAGGLSSLCCPFATMSTPELYDPATGTFAPTGSFVGPGDMQVSGGPNSPTAVLLRDGRVLFVGEPFSEIYDPASGTFSETGAMTTMCGSNPGFRPSYIGGRTATLLRNGDVLVTGGGNEDCGRFADAEIYDAASGTFRAIGAMSHRRVWHTATTLADGTVLLVGGESESGFSLVTEATADSYDPATGALTPAGAMSGGRELHTATLLQDGRVLLAGGEFFAGVGAFLGSLNSAEIFSPASSLPPVPVFPADGTTPENLHPRLQLHNVVATGKTIYRFEWSERSDFAASATAVADEVPQGPGGDTAYEVADRLLPDTRYYWRARATIRPETGQPGIPTTSAYSETRSFRTPRNGS